MRQATRRHFIGTGTAGLAGILLARRRRARQKRELTLIGWSHFVPASDLRLHEQCEQFAREANVSVRSDHIPHAQLAAKQASELQTRAGTTSS